MVRTASSLPQENRTDLGCRARNIDILAECHSSFCALSNIGGDLWRKQALTWRERGHSGPAMPRCSRPLTVATRTLIDAANADLCALAHRTTGAASVVSTQAMTNGPEHLRLNVSHALNSGSHPEVLSNPLPATMCVAAPTCVQHA